jgi:hypothetical protein
LSFDGTLTSLFMLHPIGISGTNHKNYFILRRETWKVE